MNLRRLIPFGMCAAVALFLSPQPIVPAQATLANSPIIQLTNNRALDVRPAWSPDNRMIAFQSNRDSETYHIYVMNADGSEQRALTKGATDNRHPVWMPDGKSILFDSEVSDEREEIWMVNIADGSLKQITHLGAQANFPSPSPDGQRVMFYLYKDHLLNLWSARMDGSDAKPLTTALARAQDNQCTFACHSAAWSTDSQAIAYSSGDHKSVWLARSDGSDAKEIIANSERNHFPWFLPDGRLGYITEHVSSNQAWTDAWVYDLKSNQPTLLQEKMSPQGPFEWSTDNKKILFHSPRSGNFDIYVIDLDAPNGIDALRGMPVPVTLATGLGNPAAPAATLPATPETSSPVILGIVAAFGAIVAAGVVGFALWRRARH